MCFVSHCQKHTTRVQGTSYISFKYMDQYIYMYIYIFEIPFLNYENYLGIILIQNKLRGP
jgi:hypothetical protein